MKRDYEKREERECYREKHDERKLDYVKREEMKRDYEKREQRECYYEKHDERKRDYVKREEMKRDYERREEREVIVKKGKKGNMFMKNVSKGKVTMAVAVRGRQAPCVCVCVWGGGGGDWGTEPLRAARAVEADWCSLSRLNLPQNLPRSPFFPMPSPVMQWTQRCTA